MKESEDEKSEKGGWRKWNKKEISKWIIDVFSGCYLIIKVFGVN